MDQSYDRRSHQHCKKAHSAQIKTPPEEIPPAVRYFIQDNKLTKTLIKVPTSSAPIHAHSVSRIRYRSLCVIVGIIVQAQWAIQGKADGFCRTA
jgi:hypothetical protein